MNTRQSFRWLWPALAVVCLTVPFFANKAATQSQGGTPTANVKTAGGLTVVTFVVNPGTIKVNLPDDMRAGDTISGTVITEPKGNTKEERGANQSELNKLGIRIKFSDLPEEKPKEVSCSDASAPFNGVLVHDEKALLGMVVAVFQKLATVVTPPPPPPGNQPSLDAITFDLPPPQHVWAPSLDERKISTNPKTILATPPSGAVTPTFILPPLGQTGRPIVITGPFDGNSSTTTFNWTASRSSVQDFEKNIENVSGGFGLIAESPRKAVFQAPTTVTGPMEVNLKEGNVETKGTYHNVGVKLSAPKTDLLKGEKTTLTVEVNGLEGIKRPVPLTLTYQGVIVMEGGNYQPLMIQPTEVSAGGRYSTTRGITGVQPGGWGATATVVTNPFDFCLQDDSVPARVVLLNTFTGDYIFTCSGCLPPKNQQGGAAGNTGESGGTKTGGTTQSGGTTTTAGPTGAQESSTGSPSSLSGTGTVTRKGCIITLTHNAPDRRVFAKLDPCINSGTTTIETSSKIKFTITDRNTTDNTCACGPGCK